MRDVFAPSYYLLLLLLLLLTFFCAGPTMEQGGQPLRYDKAVLHFYHCILVLNF